MTERATTAPATRSVNEPLAADQGPWSPRDVTRSLLTALVAVVGVATCYLAASSSIALSTQLICLAIAIIFVAVAGAGSAALLADGLRSVRIRRLEASRHIALLIEQRREHPLVPLGGEEDRQSLVSGDNMSRYHRPDCLLVATKQVRASSRAEHAAAGRSGCDICKPDLDPAR